MYLVDTSVWIDIFRETESGKNAMKKIAGKDRYACAVTIVEMSKWCHSNNFAAAQILPRVETSCSGILNSSRAGEFTAGKMWFKANKGIKRSGRQVGLIDCIIAATAEENGLTVLTQDKHFQRFTNIKKEII